MNGSTSPDDPSADKSTRTSQIYRIAAGLPWAVPTSILTADIGILMDDGSEFATIVVFQRDSERVRLFYAAEMPPAADPGQDPRTAPDIASLWSLLDLTPGGRAADWCPRLSYS